MRRFCRAVTKGSGLPVGDRYTLINPQFKDHRHGEVIVVSIDSTGKWWIGDQPNDIREFLEAYASDGYKVDEFRLTKCTCGSERFLLWADDDEGCAKRQCESCKRSSFVGDSEEYREEAKPEQWKCTVCKSKAGTCNVGVGFSLYSGRRSQVALCGRAVRFLRRFRLLRRVEGRLCPLSPIA